MLSTETRRCLVVAADRLARIAVNRLDLASDAGQRHAHGVAWLASHAMGLRALDDWATRLEARDAIGAKEAAILGIGFHEYASRMATGLPMGPTETARPDDLGIEDACAAFAEASAPLTRDVDQRAARASLAAALVDDGLPDPADEDADLSLMRDQYRRFAEAEIAPRCHAWHLADDLIPDETVAAVAALGTFAVTLPEAHGGLALSKQAMAVVTEELSAVHLATGSLATRPEIAGELIATGGTEEQKARFLPGIASGEILPTAVFTEPDIGSDLAHLSTRASRENGVYRVTGSKTWITHGGRSDLMTLLVRTDPSQPDHRGLSMLLAEKPRGTVDDPFPASGMRGGEIRTLGYRGMKEYDIAFDGFQVAEKNLLGGIEGQGFKQLMATFESARIQTAARAVGVARHALRLALDHATTRKQFGAPLISFERISDKIALMAVEMEIARQLTGRAATAKDTGRRCDVEAGMAKLLAARAAWVAADDALQIHGGMGYAEETPISRVLVDARILNIFEGTGEIQAHVIARGLVNRRN